MVTSYATRFNTQKFYVLPTHSSYVLWVWMSENAAGISFHCVNWLVSIPKVDYVYYAVRNEYSYVIQVNNIFKGRAMAQAVVARLPPRASHSIWHLWWTRWHRDRFLSEYYGLPCIIPLKVHMHFHLKKRFFWWRALQQILWTHRSLEAYRATLWWRWLVVFFFPCSGTPVGWNWRGKPKYSGRNPSKCHFVHNKSYTESNPGLRGERPATIRLSHGTAKIYCY
jgi:hypothetical protein